MTETERNLKLSILHLKHSLQQVEDFLDREYRREQQKEINALRSHGAWVRERKRMEQRRLNQSR
jgi:hypothetical protein